MVEDNVSLLMVKGMTHWNASVGSAETADSNCLVGCVCVTYELTVLVAYWEGDWVGETLLEQCNSIWVLSHVRREARTLLYLCVCVHHLNKRR